MADEQIALTIDLPPMIESPYRIEVRCGETTCDVYEHGVRGSGDWAAWPTQGLVTGYGGTIGYTLDQALDDARSYVRRVERSRLFRAQLAQALVATSQPTPTRKDNRS